MSNAEQGGQNMSKTNYISGCSKYVPTTLKVIELLLAIVCIGLIDDPANNSKVRIFAQPRTVALAYSSFASLIIICGIYILGKCIQDTMQWKLVVLVNLVGSILFIATAACILSDWSDTKNRNYWPPNTQRMDLLCATGSIAIIAAAFFIIDFLFTLRQGVRGNLE